MDGKQRLDKWLWFARVVKTRSLASQLILAGHVRVNAQRIETPSKSVAPGDVLTIALANKVAVLRVVAIGARRGPFSEARLLFEDLTAPAEDEARNGDAASRSNMPRVKGDKAFALPNRAKGVSKRRG